MARTSRQQRRARRAAQAGESTFPQQQREQRDRALARREEAAAAEPAREDGERREERVERAERERGGFVRESYGELRKVEWPGRQQVLAGTLAVIVACAIVGAYLYVADLAFQNLVEKVIL